MIASTQAIASSNILHVGMSFIPTKIDHLEIHSINEYIIFDDLLRPLVKFDSNGEISADLVLKWEITDNHKKFIFTLKRDQYFSDGTLITSEDVVASLRHLIKSPEIVHGDGKKIKKVEKLDDFKFEIELYDSDPFFLTELSSPEYRIIKRGQSNYVVTSGPYSIKSNSLKNTISIVQNPKYTFSKNVKYNEVHFEQYEELPLTKSSSEKFDLIWPPSTIKPDEIEKIKSFGFNVYQLNLGFSYWLTINPAHLTKKERNFIKKRLDNYWYKNSFFETNNLDRSSQLFLPYGPGRLTEKEVSDILHDDETKIHRTLKVLLPSTVYKEIKDSLKNLGVEIEYNYYENFSQYAQLIKKNSYDLLLVNNDLSSTDLRSSLIVTFNPSRPLVYIDKKNRNYEKLLQKIQTEQNNSIRYSQIKELGKMVLDDTLVYPLYYKMGFLFARKNIDLTEWNKAGAETFSWKIK